MTRRTPIQEWKLDRLADRIHLRELAQEVPCEYCHAPAGRPCVYLGGRWQGQPLELMDHTCRLTAARRQRAHATQPDNTQENR